MLCCECPAVGEIVAWVDNDPASGVVDEPHNQMIDRILTAYEAAWPKERRSRWRKGHMSIWSAQPTLEALRQQATGTMIEHLGIEFLDVGDDYLSARLPVDARSMQPFGILNGGASAASGDVDAGLENSYRGRTGAPGLHRTVDDGGAESPVAAGV